MTPVFCCGFECGILGTGTGAGQHWIAGSVPATIDTSVVRSGARSLKCDGSGASGGSASCSLGASAYWVVRAYVYFDSLPAGKCGLVVGASSGMGAVFEPSTNKIYAGRRGSGSYGASGVSVTEGQWYRIDVKIDLSNNPWLADVKVNGTDCAQYGYASAASSDAGFSVGTAGAGLSDAGLAYFDDIVASNTAGDYPIGAGYVNHFVPTSDGSHNVASANDFERGTTGTDIVNSTTDSYLLVDDVPMDDTTPDTDDSIGCIAPPNATDYTENVFGPASGISTPTTGPRAVEVIVAHHQAGTGIGVSSFYLHGYGGSFPPSATDLILSLTGAGATTTRYARKHYALDPWGVDAWTATEFNNLRIRFGYSSDANPDQFFDCAMIEAEWEEVPTTNVKTLQGVSYLAANIKTVQGLAFASVKSIQGLE